jgi:hypothetical protein
MLGGYTRQENSMTAKISPRRDGILFSFTDSDLHGSVIVRDGEMVLDIPGGDGPYLIIGRARGHYYEGENNIRGGNHIEAKWAEMGDEFVGVWREENEEYFFTFRL